MRINKILCPGEKHRRYRYEKILFGYEERPGAPRVFYVHCDDVGCKNWHKVTFNENGNFFIEVLPKKNPKTNRNLFINFIKIPAPEKC